MSDPLQKLLSEYAESHQNPTNKKIHWICVPLILWSLLGLLRLIPFPEISQSLWNLDWSKILVVFAIGYYWRLSRKLTYVMLFVSLGAIFSWDWWIDQGHEIAPIAIAVFILAWIGQFIGHKIEGKKPSFLKDLQFLLIGPLWLCDQALGGRRR